MGIILFNREIIKITVNNQRPIHLGVNIDLFPPIGNKKETSQISSRKLAIEEVRNRIYNLNNDLALMGLTNKRIHIW